VTFDIIDGLLLNLLQTTPNTINNINVADMQTSVMGMTQAPDMCNVGY
jgi:hypothetical protein